MTLHTQRDCSQDWTAEQDKLALAEDAIAGLQEALAGQLVSEEELEQALRIAPNR